MAIGSSVNVSRNFSFNISQQSNAIRRSGARTVGDIARLKSQALILSPQQIGNNASDLVQTAQNGKSAQSRFLDIFG